MKRVISLLILMIILFLGIEWLVTFFTKTHEVNYSVYNDEIKFEITEKYEKDNNDTYDLEISVNDNIFYYSVDNYFNKQKKIVKEIEYFNDGDNICIYPILSDNKGTYLECISNNNLYSSYTYPNQVFISDVNNKLTEKGYVINKVSSLDGINYGNTTLYKNNVLDGDTILLWQYKGIYLLNNSKQTNIMSLSFDKYENKLGALVGKYYVIPYYTSSKVLEFNSVSAINIETGKQTKITLDYTLSSDTYLNGVIDGKLYYTDPSNLLQIEINPSSKNVKLIGSSDLGGKTYDGSWKDTNIYDFRNREILFKNTSDISEFNYSYVDIEEGSSSYYFYTSDGSIYQVLKEHLDKPILIYKAPNLNNFNVVGNDIYYVVDNTLYYFSIKNGNLKVLESNDLIYNTYNRVSIYRD